MKRTTTAFLFLLALSAAPTAAQDVGGCWVGRAGDGPAALTLERAGARWEGSMHRLLAPVVSIALTSAEVSGDSVRLTFPWGEPREPATLAGRAAGDSLTGSIRAGGREARVALARIDSMRPVSARELSGYWSGGLEQGGAVVLRLGVGISPAPCGTVVASMDSPDQGAMGIPITDVRLLGDSVRFEVPGVGGAFRGQLDAARTTLRGTWTQGPASLSMTLERGEGPRAWNRPQNPTPPFPYASAEVSYQNPRDGTTLAGTLTLPPGDGPFPAVLLLSGSGAQDRDESLMGHRPFLVLADYLTRRGIAVLRVDDRGVGGSSGNTMEATIPDNVSDAAAGVDFLRRHQRIDAGRVGLIGHSEGGWVAPELAAHDEGVAFVVMLAGPAAAPRDLLLAQSRAILEAAGEGMVEEQIALNARLLDIVRAEPDNAEAMAKMRAAVREWLERLPDEQRARFQSPEMQAQLEQSMQAETTPWFRGLLAHDPLPSLQALDVPVLALFGERDLQVPPSQSVPILEAIWADHPDATVRVLPGLNHLFQHAESGLISEYAQIEETFAPEALSAIADWILARAAPPQSGR